MREAARALEFERAAELRDEIADLKRFLPSTAMGGASRKLGGSSTGRAMR
jgi:excinuclease UvrABC nuclease subunit